MPSNQPHNILNLLRNLLLWSGGKQNSTLPRNPPASRKALVVRAVCWGTQRLSIDLLEASPTASAGNLGAIQLNASSASHWHVRERDEEFSNKQPQRLWQWFLPDGLARVSHFTRLFFSSHIHGALPPQRLIHKKTMLDFFSSPPSQVSILYKIRNWLDKFLLQTKNSGKHKHADKQIAALDHRDSLIA